MFIRELLFQPGIHALLKSADHSVRDWSDFFGPKNHNLFSLRAKSFHPSIVAGIHQASSRFQKLLPDVKTFTNDKVCSHPKAEESSDHQERPTSLYFCDNTNKKPSRNFWKLKLENLLLIFANFVPNLKRNLTNQSRACWLVVVAMPWLSFVPSYSNVLPTNGKNHVMSWYHKEINV